MPCGDLDPKYVDNHINWWPRAIIVLSFAIVALIGTWLTIRKLIQITGRLALFLRKLKNERKKF